MTPDEPPSNDKFSYRPLWLTMRKTFAETSDDYEVRIGKLGFGRFNASLAALEGDAHFPMGKFFYRAKKCQIFSGRTLPFFGEAAQKQTNSLG